jgi:type I restriction enzyme S subunit
MTRIYRVGDFLLRLKIPVEIQNADLYKRLTIRINHQGVSVRDTEKGASIGTKNQFRVRAGDFILSKIDARQGAFGIVPPDADGGIITGNFWTFKVNDRIVDVEWFLQFTNSDAFLDLCKRSSTGNTHRKYLSEEIFLNHELEIPPLEDQFKVVQQCKTGRGQVQIIEQEIAHQEDLVAKLKQAILQEAITGRLTAGWRAAQADVEPASQLLARIRAEKARLVADKKLRPEKSLPPIPETEIPFAIPKGWEWCRLGQSGILKRGKSKHRPRNDERLFENGTVPFVQTGDVAQSKHTGFLIGTNSGQYNAFGVSQSQLWPAGTMCITIAANIAETGFLTKPACVPDSVVTYTSPAGSDAPRYVRMFIELTRTMIEKFAPATAQKNINLEILNELDAPPPSPSGANGDRKTGRGLDGAVSGAGGGDRAEPRPSRRPAPSRPPRSLRPRHKRSGLIFASRPEPPRLSILNT